MSATKLQLHGYDSVLESLREHKEKIDRAIQALEELRDSPIPTSVVPEKVGTSSGKDTGDFSGMHFLGAVRSLLAQTDGPLTTSQITERLLGGGFSSDSENPKKVIAAQLHRYAGDHESGIIKTARSLWTLDKTKPRRSS